MLISVVVPTYRRPYSLRELLRGLSVQTLEVPFEVVVVDDGGGGLERVVQPFRGHLDLKLLTQPNSGPAQARNHGARYATGARLVFVDDDCVPEANWLQRTAEAHAQYPEAAIGGVTWNILTGNVYSSASQLLLDFVYQYFQEDNTRDGVFFTTNNLSVPRQSFLATGGFDTEFSRAAGEDREFSDRWRYLGGELVFEPKIIVGHAHPLSLRSFVGQHFHYGMAAKRYWRLKRLREGGKRKSVRAPFYSRLICSPLVRFGFTTTTGKLASLLVLSQAVNALGYLAAPEPNLDIYRQPKPSRLIADVVNDGPVQGV